jgi:hypothetical protein
MVQPVLLRKELGIIGYRPRVAWFVMHGDKVILQVKIRVVNLHPCDMRQMSEYSYWRDATPQDFIPPSLPSVQFAEMAA